GLTIVAFGTSAPELTVSGYSALTGQADIALGNVIGSTIFNVLFILGVSALITPLAVAQQLIRFEVPLMISVACLVGLMAWDGQLSRLDGAMLFLGLVTYLLWAVRQCRTESADIAAEYEHEYAALAPPRSRADILKQLGMTILGLIMLVLGSKLFTDGAVNIARAMGMSELVIGLTIVAVGTSLPEVATSISAALKGERDIAVGNAIGSNLFNMLGVLGAASFLSPTGMNVPESAIAFDIPVMIAVCVVTLPVLYTGYTITRSEGFLLLLYFVAYNGFLLWATHQPNVQTSSGFVALALAIPLGISLLTLAAVSPLLARK
ncbi:MAG: calcium/sodium antiporter, partial [Planctomycetales bacterium]|nr:calcium/sodium antiporter [Planctomycetales bacterium]